MGHGDSKPKTWCNGQSAAKPLDRQTAYQEERSSSKRSHLRNQVNDVLRLLVKARWCYKKDCAKHGNTRRGLETNYWIRRFV